MVVVKAELTMVHQNIVKLRMIPITIERIKMTRNVKEFACNEGEKDVVSVRWSANQYS